jgi:uncharacterized membrane protein
MPDFHTLNIFTHITAGSLAILAGSFVLARRKGDAVHRLAGRITVGLAIICVTTALIGAVVFRGKLDLVGASIIISYNLWAGVRALKLKGNGRGIADVGPAILVFITGNGLFALSQIEGLLNWQPALVYATAGSLVAYGGWDMIRTLLPSRWRLWLNPAEHAFRMAGLIAALMSVAAATLIPSPYVALGISGIGSIIAFVFAFRAARKAVGVMPSAALKARLKADSEL